VTGDQCRWQPDWMSRVKTGSVLAPAYGDWRIVRKVSRNPNGNLSFVWFVIKRRSWTNRCYTVVTYSDLLQRGFRLVGQLKKNIDPKLDLKIAHAINQPCHKPYALTASDVVGIR
jgi:hypothetical protein